MDLARLKELRAIGVREYEEDEHGFRVVFDDRQPAAADKKPGGKKGPGPHHAALIALRGGDFNPDQPDTNPNANRFTPGA